VWELARNAIYSVFGSQNSKGHCQGKQGFLRKVRDLLVREQTSGGGNFCRSGRRREGQRALEKANFFSLDGILRGRLAREDGDYSGGGDVFFRLLGGGASSVLD